MVTTSMDTTSDLCGKDVYRRSEIDGSVVGDICPCVRFKDHEDECLCQHMVYRRTMDDPIKPNVLGNEHIWFLRKDSLRGSET